MRRLGVLMPAADDGDLKDRMAAFVDGLEESGWSIGRNLRIETRWGASNPTAIARYAAELAALAPDVMVACSGSTVGALRRATRTVPIVFPGSRSGCRRLRRQPGAAGRQRHRVSSFSNTA